MEHYVGLDVSLKETAVCVIDGEGNRVWQGKCASNPEDMETVIRRRAPLAVRIALETGPLCVWHWHALRAVDLPVVCIHARHAKAARGGRRGGAGPGGAGGRARGGGGGWD